MDKLSGMIVGSDYKLLEQIGCGHFGVVYRAINTTKRNEVAVKLEPIREGRDFSMLRNEYTAYKKINMKDLYLLCIGLELKKDITS